MFGKLKEKIKNASTKTKVLAGTVSIMSVPSLAFADGVSPSGGLNEMTTAISGMFGQMQSTGVKIVCGAIGLGVTFITAKWVWGKAKQWVART